MNLSEYFKFNLCSYTIINNNINKCNKVKNNVFFGFYFSLILSYSIGV